MVHVLHRRGLRLLSTRDKTGFRCPKVRTNILRAKPQHVLEGRAPRPQAWAPAGDQSVTRQAKSRRTFSPQLGKGGDLLPARGLRCGTLDMLLLLLGAWRKHGPPLLPAQQLSLSSPQLPWELTQSCPSAPPTTFWGHAVSPGFPRAGQGSLGQRGRGCHPHTYCWGTPGAAAGAEGTGAPSRAGRGGEAPVLSPLSQLRVCAPRPEPSLSSRAGRRGLTGTGKQ